MNNQETMNKYIIVDADAIQKRIEELGKPFAHYDGVYVSERQYAQIEILEEILSQSTPLIPEIEKAFYAGCSYTIGSHENFKQTHPNKKEYISNLKYEKFI